MKRKFTPLSELDSTPLAATCKQLSPTSTNPCSVYRAMIKSNLLLFAIIGGTMAIPSALFKTQSTTTIILMRATICVIAINLLIDH